MSPSPYLPHTNTRHNVPPPPIGNSREVVHPSKNGEGGLQVVTISSLSSVIYSVDC